MSSEDCQEEIRGKYDNYSIFDVRRPLGKWQHLCVYLFGNSSFMVEMCRREGPFCKRTPNDEKPLTVQNIDKNLLLAKLPKATRWQNMPNYNRLVFIWHVGSKLMMLRTMCKLCKVELANIFQGWHSSTGKQDRALSDWEAYLYQLSPSPQRVLAGGSDSSDAKYELKKYSYTRPSLLCVTNQMSRKKRKRTSWLREGQKKW